MMKEDILQYKTPEEVGISSKNIESYIRLLESKHLATHNLILARGNQIFFEQYWKPFTSDFQHRMYSVSKSFVALAVGFLEQDGLVKLDDPISLYFPEELACQPDKNMHRQTIRHMLMMCTAKVGQNWFEAQTDDRVRFYFENNEKGSRPPGTIFKYDSTGSFVLGALVERLTGKTLMAYLKEKLFDEIGVSPNAYCLTCPGGHSWGDSAILCTPMDLLRVARFTMNGGSWDGKQILNPAYVHAATSKLVDNNFADIHARSNYGYGYLIWRTYQNSFYFCGMGCQFAVCVPDQDLIMIYNADNQGKADATSVILDGFFEWIVNKAAAEPLLEDRQALGSLRAYGRGLQLVAAEGSPHSGFEDVVQGKTYTFHENPMGISKMSLSFEGNTGCLSYTNEQGDKKLVFGLGHNEFGLFPQEGYSSCVGSQFAPGNYYKCAASAAWVEEQKLRIVVQIIDRYFGNLSITLGFVGEEVGVYMEKNAEFFLNEYSGFGYAICEEGITCTEH